jgi:hypothetical protein
MGLTLWVHRSPLGDSTNGGLSGRFDRLTVVNVEGPFEPTPDHPAVMLVPNALGSVVIMPAEKIGDEWLEIASNTKAYAGPMFGGNYAATSDSRFGRAVEAILGHRFYGAVPIHDRLETWSDYEALTR